MLLRILKNKGYIWLPGYLKSRQYHRKIRYPKNRDVHLIFLVVDHFEPSRTQGLMGIRNVREWCKKYEKIAKLHNDSDGRYPQHTWFYRYDYPSYECINILNEYVFKGLGEIEFHLHHSYDTSESFTKNIFEGVSWFNQAGAMISAESIPHKRFGYIAGNWALDNGRRNPAYSGVNNELKILNNAGCYADFTFPAIGTNAQPRKVNSIYYATDTAKPKSYNKGTNVAVNGTPSGDLMIFQGPLYVDWKHKYTESAALESFAPYRARRIDNWIRAGIHVAGRPEWIFVKLHTHGMQSRDVFFGDQLNNMLTDLENRFKKSPYHLHYVTAREAYNIVKAAEAGEQGDPEAFRDFSIPKPINNEIFCNYPYTLEEFSDHHIIVNIKSVSTDTVIIFKNLPLRSIKGGKITRVEITYAADFVKRLSVNGTGTTCFKGTSVITSANYMKTVSLPFSTSKLLS